MQEHYCYHILEKYLCLSSTQFYISLTKYSGNKCSSNGKITQSPQNVETPFTHKFGGEVATLSLHSASITEEKMQSYTAASYPSFTIKTKVAMFSSCSSRGNCTNLTHGFSKVHLYNQKSDSLLFLSL